MEENKDKIKEELKKILPEAVYRLKEFINRGV